MKKKCSAPLLLSSASSWRISVTVDRRLCWSFFSQTLENTGTCWWDKENDCWRCCNQSKTWIRLWENLVNWGISDHIGGTVIFWSGIGSWVMLRNTGKIQYPSKMSQSDHTGWQGVKHQKLINHIFCDDDNHDDYNSFNLYFSSGSPILSCFT